ncbi:hypothetical protein [Pseudomonas syringae]|uniref:hypothetical protein n=1 Tax=Pseudomonas syringae TaxID=317 RepID=UPI0034D78E7B
MKPFLLDLWAISGGKAAVVAGAVALEYEPLSALTCWNTRGALELVFMAICALIAVACPVRNWKLNKRYGWYWNLPRIARRYP